MIVETYSKIKHLSRMVKELSNIQDKGEQKALMQRRKNYKYTVRSIESDPIDQSGGSRI